MNNIKGRQYNMKLEKTASVIALAAMISSTLVPAYASEITTLPVVTNVTESIDIEQTGSLIDADNDALATDAAYSILNVLMDRYSEILNVESTSLIALCEEEIKAIDGYKVHQYSLVEDNGSNTAYKLGTISLTEKDDILKSVIFTGSTGSIDKGSLKFIATWKPAEVGMQNIKDTKRLGVTSLGQYSSGLMQPWCAVTCATSIMNYFNTGDSEPLDLAKVILPVVFDSKNNANYWDRSSEEFKTALGADIDMQYRFYNGINSYQLRDLLGQSGFQSTYSNSPSSRLYTIGSEIKSGSVIIAELSRNGKPSHAIVFDEYTDRVLVGFDTSSNNTRERIVMVYGNTLLSDSISNSVIYLDSGTPRCYSLTGYVTARIPEGRSINDIFKTEEEYNQSLTNIGNIKNTILHSKRIDTANQYADELKIEEEKAYNEYIERKNRISDTEWSELSTEDRNWVTGNLKYQFKKEDIQYSDERVFSDTAIECVRYLTDRDLVELTEDVLKLDRGQGGLMLYDSIEEEARAYAKDKALEKVMENHNIADNIACVDSMDDVDYSSPTMVDWAKNDDVLNQVLIDVLRLDKNQVGLYVEGIPSLTDYGKAVLDSPEMAVYSYMCTLSEYTVNKEIITEINPNSTSEIRRAKTYLDDISKVFGKLKIGYRIGEMEPTSWLDKMLNIRMHNTTSIGAVYKYDTMRSLLDQNKAVIMMFRNKDTNERYSIICIDGVDIGNNKVRYTVLDPFDANSGDIKKSYITCNSNGKDCTYNNELIPTNMKWVSSVVTEGTITGDVYNLDYNNNGDLVPIQ